MKHDSTFFYVNKFSLIMYFKKYTYDLQHI